MSPAMMSAFQEGFGGAFMARRAWQRQQAAEGRILELLQRGRGGLLQRAARADKRHVGQPEVDDWVSVADRRSVPRQRLNQPGMVEAGRHQHALFGEDTRLRAVGQDHGPTFQPGRMPQPSTTGVLLA
jgi:hypothetical protein